MGKGYNSEGPFDPQAWAINNQQGWGEDSQPSGQIQDGYGESKMLLVDARTLETGDPVVISSDRPVKVASMGRLGLALVNSDLLRK